MPAHPPAVTLAGALWPEKPALSDRLLRGVLLALLGSLLVAFSAQIQVPMYPVPMTMQPFAVLLIGAAYGSRLGALTVLLYMAEGAAGLPVFAGMKGGFVHLLGPTGGYIAGFIAAAAVVGLLAERGWHRSIAFCLAAMTIGMALIYLLGVGRLASLIGLDKAFAVGMLPFLVGDAVKIALAALILPGASTLVDRFGR